MPDVRGRTELEQTFEIWSRRKWLAIVVAVAVFTAVASVVTVLPDIYRSTATVLVERHKVPETFIQSLGNHRGSDDVASHPIHATNICPAAFARPTPCASCARGGCGYSSAVGSAVCDALATGGFCYLRPPGGIPARGDAMPGGPPGGGPAPWV